MSTESKTIKVGDKVRWESYGEERHGRVAEVKRTALVVVRLDGHLKGRMTIRMRDWVEKAA